MDERRNYLSVAAAALKAQHLALEHRQPRVSRGLTPLPGLLGSRLEGPSGKGDHVPQMRTPPRMRTPEPRGRPRSPQATAEHEPCLPSAVTEPVAPPLAPPVAPAGVPMEATAPRPPAAALEVDSNPSEGYDEESEEEEAERTSDSHVPSEEPPRNFRGQPDAQAAAERTWPSDGSQSQEESPRSQGAGDGKQLGKFGKTSRNRSDQFEFCRSQSQDEPPRNFQSQPAAQVAARTQPSDGESQDESPRNFQSQPAAKAAAARTWPSDGSESQDESPRSPKNQAAEKALAARNQPVAAATAARLPPRDSPQQNQPSPPTIAAPKRPASPPCFEASDDEDPLDRTGLGSALRVPMAPAMPRNQPSPPTIAVPKRSMSPKREVNRPRY
eukprot:s1005_g35.t1